MGRFLVPSLVVLFVLGFLVRLYRFESPVADWHSFRQGDTNAVSQIYATDGINLLYPRYFDISNVQSGMDNPQGYRFVEFPIFNAAQAAMFGIFGVFTIEQWGRLISILMTLSGAYFIFLLTKKYANELSGFFAAFFYLFLPFSIYYGRTILPDPSMTASILGGIYFFDNWLSKKNFKFQILNFKFWLSVFFVAIALLLKPFALFFTVPIIYLAYKKFDLGLIVKWQLWLFAVLSLTPLILWRVWISQFPEGIPVSAWLLNGNNIRFRPSFFKWLFYERITKLILGFSGIFFLISGLYSLLKLKNAGFFLSFLISSLLYIFVIATGNVQHDYYQILIIPTVSIFAGLGLFWIFDRLSKLTNKTFAIGLCAVILIVSLFYSWKLVRDYFNINDKGMVAAALYADKILPRDAVVIAPYDNSTTFLNIIKRRGWPVFQNDIDTLRSRGAEYLVIANPTENDFKGFGKMFKQIAKGKEYLILKLR